MALMEEVRGLLQDIVSPDLKALVVKVDALEKRLDRLEQDMKSRFDRVDSRFDRVESDMKSLFAQAREESKRLFDRAQEDAQRRHDETMTAVRTLITFQAMEQRLARLERERQLPPGKQ